ncbi:MAG: TraR/DksA C4-type zinc finger protein [Patescibacteria group bacterium]
MKNTEHYKMLLESERVRIEKELGGIGRINPENPNDWEATPGNMNTSRADKNEAADAVEEYEMRSAVEVELEKHLADVNGALANIKTGTYGICAACGEEIEEDRLEANPSATTCKKHLVS